MYKIDRRGGGVQKSFSRKLPETLNKINDIIVKMYTNKQNRFSEFSYLKRVN